MRNLPPAYAEFVTREPLKPGAETTLREVVSNPRVRFRDDIREALSYRSGDPLSVAAVELGGGVNIGLTDGIGLRLAGSYFRIFEEDASNAFRFAAGAVFPF